MRRKRNEIDFEQKSSSTAESGEPNEIAYPEQYSNDYTPFMYMASPFILTFLIELIKNYNEEETNKNYLFSKIFGFALLFYYSYEQATKNNDELINLYSNTFDMIENEKKIIFELMKTNHNKSYRFNAKHAEYFIDEVFNKVAKKLNVSLTSRYPKDSFYIFDFTPINAMVLLLNTIHENNELIASLGLAKSQLEHKYLEIKHKASVLYPTKPPLKLTISANIINYSHDKSMLLSIEKLTLCINTNLDAAVYLENIPIESLTEFTNIPPSFGNLGIGIFFTKNHEAFIISKNITELDLENDFRFKLSEKDEEIFSPAKEQKHSTPSFRFFSNTSNPTMHRRIHFTHDHVSEDTNTDISKRKEKIKTRPATHSKRPSSELSLLDEKDYEPETMKVLCLTVEDKTGKKTTTSEEKYILYPIPRYAPNLTGVEAVYALFSLNVISERKIHNNFPNYERALSGKVGDHGCSLSKNIPAKDKKNHYIIKIKPYDSDTESPGQIRILGRHFTTIKDPNAGNKSIMIIAFDCIHNKKSKDSTTIKTDPWLDETNESHKILDMKIKTVNIEEPLNDRHGKHQRIQTLSLKAP